MFRVTAPPTPTRAVTNVFNHSLSLRSIAYYCPPTTLRLNKLHLPAPLYTQLPIEDVELLHQTLRDTDTMLTAGIGGAGARYDNCINPTPPSPRAPFVCIALFHRGRLHAVGPPSVLCPACAERACSCTLSPGCALTPPAAHSPRPFAPCSLMIAGQGKDHHFVRTTQPLLCGS
jgi:hypothetical protein